MINLKRKTCFVLGLTLLFIVLLCFLVIIPQIRTIRNWKKKIDQERTKIEELVARQENLKIYRSDREKIKQDVKNFSSYLVDQNNTLDFVVKLEELASKTKNTQTLQIKEKESQEKDTLSSIPHLTFGIELQGDFKNLMDWLVNQENLVFYSEITSINILSPKSAETAQVLKTSLELRAFTK